MAAMALESVRATCSCPISSENFCGRYFRARTRYDTIEIYHHHGNPGRVPKPSRDELAPAKPSLPRRDLVGI